MIPGPIKQACAEALSAGLSFACFRMPGSEEVVFLADSGEGKPRSQLTFEISPWLSGNTGRIVIRDRMDTEIIGSLRAQNPKGASAFVSEPAISREDYLAAVSKVIDSCRRRDGKTVYSRVITGANPSLDIPETADSLFSEFPEAFGFLYFTPSTGCWLGASPETLLSVDFAEGKFSTMALAGTRNLDAADAPWDDKNLRENAFVADFFGGKFAALGLDYDISPLESVTYGPVQHLCRKITGKFTPADDMDSVLEAINPTPALCGTPTDEALRDIAACELHSRRCYGGYVAVRTPGRLDAFVNLRSALVATDGSGRFNVFAGGGITPDSDPATEFRETSAKASCLLALLSERTD